jgi:DNA polymerase I
VYNSFANSFFIAMHLVLIDGSSYLFRAYHALPPLTRSDGLPIGCVAGFCSMLWKFLRTPPITAPTHLAVVFDTAAPTFRHTLSPDYKAHRPPPPEDLIPQFPLVREAVAAFHVAAVESDGFEADDLMASYADAFMKEYPEGLVTLVASDKDLMQLVTERITMFDAMKDRVLGISDVIDKFGVPPEKVIDAQALIGDATDNIKGIPGIGPKTAAQLLQTFGDLDTLLAQAATISQPKRKEALINHADAARLARTLVTLKRDTPLPASIETFRVRPLDAQTLATFAKTYGLHSFLSRISKALDVDVATLKTPEQPVVEGSEWTPQRGFHQRNRARLPEHAGVVLIDPKDISDFVNRALHQSEIGIMGFWDGKTCLGFGLSYAMETVYIPLQSSSNDLFQREPFNPFPLLAPLFTHASLLKIGHGLKPLYRFLLGRGIRIEPVDDLELMAYVLDSGQAAIDLDAQIATLLGASPPDIKDFLGTGRKGISAAHLSVADILKWITPRLQALPLLYAGLTARLSLEKRSSVYATLERPLLPILANMEQNGIRIDVTLLKELSKTLATDIQEYEKRIEAVAGTDLNISSAKQLGVVLFETLKLSGGKKTATGQWRTDADVLEDLSSQGHAIAANILQWRQLSKLKSTYTDSLPQHVDANTGRIHTDFALAATTTGRLASLDPNLQNIPIRTSVGKAIRRAFIAKEGCTLIAADYSQIELRLLAHIADIPELKAAFLEGVDIHTKTAAEMFHVKREEVDSELRRRAKAINFGIVYGISAFGLANQLGISREEAGAYIKLYFERFPRMRDYMEETKKFCFENGFVETLFGRMCSISTIRSRNANERAAAERQAINAPIQGSAADVLRRAMIKVDEALALTQTKILLQVHDELVLEAPLQEVESVLPLIEKAMRTASSPILDLSVPLSVDIRAAATWAEAHG